MKTRTKHAEKMPHRVLASASMDGTVQSWSLDGHITNLLHQWNEHAGEVFALACSPDGTSIASAGKDTTVCVWHALSGELAFRYGGHCEAVYALSWSLDGKLLASGGRDRTVQVWDVSTGEQLLCYRGHTHSVTSLAWSPDGRRIASCGGDSGWQVWDASSGARHLIGSPHPCPGTIYALAWSPRGDTLALAGRGIALVSLGVEFGERAQALRLLDDETQGREDSYALACSPDGTRLASGGFSGRVRIWQVSTGRPVRSLWGQQGYIRALSWSPDGKLLASGGWDGTVQVWDVSSGRKLASYEGHFRPVSAVIWLPLMPQDAVSLALLAEDSGAVGGNGAPPDQDRASGMAPAVFPPLYTRISPLPTPSVLPASDGVPEQEERCPPRKKPAIPGTGATPAATGAVESVVPKEVLRPLTAGNHLWELPAWPASILFALSPSGLLLLLLLLTLTSFGTGIVLFLVSSLVHTPLFFLQLLFD